VAIATCVREEGQVLITGSDFIIKIQNKPVTSLDAQYFGDRTVCPAIIKACLRQGTLVKGAYKNNQITHT